MLIENKPNGYFPPSPKSKFLSFVEKNKKFVTGFILGSAALMFLMSFFIPSLFDSLREAVSLNLAGIALPWVFSFLVPFIIMILKNRIWIIAIGIIVIFSPNVGYMVFPIGKLFKEKAFTENTTCSVNEKSGIPIVLKSCQGISFLKGGKEEFICSDFGVKSKESFLCVIEGVETVFGIQIMKIESLTK